MKDPLLIYDSERGNGWSTEFGTRFELITDQVMGGVSNGQLRLESVSERRALHLTGQVRLDNNGGFIQLAADVKVDASPFSVLRLSVRGEGSAYGCHLRTDAVTRPWQSYRADFVASEAWKDVDLPLQHFLPHRLSAPFDPRTVRRLGLVAIGRAFAADLALSKIQLL